VTETEQVLTIVQSVLVLAIFMAVGFVAVKVGYVRKEVGFSISALVTRFMYPAWAISKVLSPSVSKEQIIEMFPMLFAALIIILFLLGIAFIVGKIMHVDRKRMFTLFPLFSAPNSVFFGLPICLGLFGEEGGLLCTIAALGADVSTWTVTVSLMNMGAAEDSKKSRFHLAPATVAFIVAFALKFLNIQIPELILTPLSKMGEALSYIAMIYLGMVLTEIKIGGILKEKITYVHLILKCFVHPFIIGTVMGLLGFSEVAAGVLTIMFATSPMISMNVLYRELGLDYRLGSGLTLICILINIVTIPTVFWVTNSFGNLLGLY